MSGIPYTWDEGLIILLSVFVLLIFVIFISVIKKIGIGKEFAYAIIKLDGAGTGFLHVLGEVDLEKIKEGMRVKAVFAEERVGLPTDIAYFKPID